MFRKLLLAAPAVLAAWLSASAARSPGTPPAAAIRTHEGTYLSFDLSADGRWIAFDLLGQLWLLPGAGGAARAITDAVADVAEDLDPSFSPDGGAIVYRAERNGRTGLWLLDVRTAVSRQLTQLADPDGYDGNASWSADGSRIAFVRAFPDRSAKRVRSDLMILDVASGTARQVPFDGAVVDVATDPVWLAPDRIAFVGRNVRSNRGGRIWMVPETGGRPEPVTDESTEARAPVFSSDGRVAYFAPDDDGRVQVWMQDVGKDGRVAGARRQLTRHGDVTPTRLRWTRDARALVYSADGRLWKASSAGGTEEEIPFSAELSIQRPARSLPQARFPESGGEAKARGFMGLALSPDGQRIAMLALGKLWVIQLGGGSREVARVPFEAAGISWSPDGSEIAWSAGSADQEDMFATRLTDGETRRVTALAGREAFPVYSPDGRHIAFVHAAPDPRLRVIDARGPTVRENAQSRDLGPIALNAASPPQWSPASDGLLVTGDIASNPEPRATFVSLSGARQDLERFPDAPIFFQWTPGNAAVFVRHDRLWQARFDRTGLLADPQPLGKAAALYASTSRDGSVLFVSENGLRVRGADGVEQNVGWPISYSPAIGESMVIRNVRLIDGTGAPPTAPRDIAVELGRITRIGPAGTAQAGGGRVIDAAGRIAVPGLIDLHAHTYQPGLLPGFLYFGIMTVRDQGSSIAPLVAYADAIAAGALPGPRVAYGGFQFYSDWAFDDEQGRGIEPEADLDHVTRAVALAEAFGAQHVKTRTFRRWDINARIIAEAHRRGLRATGHCAHQLPLVAAAMDAKEHIGLCEPRGNGNIYDDLIQLYRAADIPVVPTIVYLALAARINEHPEILDADAEVRPFLPARESFDWMVKLTPAERRQWAADAQRARDTTAKLARAGVTIGAGTDVWQSPVGLHMELEELVSAGLSPLQALHAATGAAARILGAETEFGTIEVGKRADLLLLDADPLADIRNTRRISQIVQNGRVVDRGAIANAAGRH